jgi:Pyruvate/2-oxoacid:ferredoxin oxidoreductase delta subunit
MDERGLPVIDPARCTGCGICVRECPRGTMGLLELVTDQAPVIVRCNAHDRPKERRANCSACCIACKKCERECPSDAIHVIDGVAVVDYERCTGCGTCVTVCPQRCIDVYGRTTGQDATASDGAGPGGRATPDSAAIEAI